MFQIIKGKVFSDTVESLLFGPMANERIPYSVIASRWRRHQKLLLRPARYVCYQYAVLGYAVYSPVWLAKKVYRLATKKGDGDDGSEPDYTIKPPADVDNCHAEPVKPAPAVPAAATEDLNTPLLG